MKMSWLIGIMFLFVVTTLTCATIEGGTALGYKGGEAVEKSAMEVLEERFEVQGTDFSNPITGIVSIVRVTWAWFAGLLSILFFDYPSIFYGDYDYFRLVFLWPISIAFIGAIVLAIVRGTSST